MQRRGDKDSSPDETVADQPKSFEPREPGRQTAWDQLDQLGRVAQRSDEADAEELIGLARAIVELRRSRGDVFPHAIFGEPAWDMMLALFVQTPAGKGETVSNLSLSSGTPSTTALRWIDYLEREAYVTRRSCRIDKRLVFVNLTDKADGAIRDYLTRLIDKQILAVPKR
jgi:DNA-binding MarR family transcriptional regulator